MEEQWILYEHRQHDGYEEEILRSDVRNSESVLVIHHIFIPVVVSVISMDLKLL